MELGLSIHTFTITNVLFKASSLRLQTPNNADKKNTRVHQRKDYDQVNIQPTNTRYINTDSNINDCNY